MYWQVYLHKTVLSVEQMLIKAVDRAKILVKEGKKVPSTDALQYFLENDVSLKEFKTGEAIKWCAMLDDNDIFTTLKHWQSHSDPLLSILSKGILERKLFKVQMSEKPFSKAEVSEILSSISKKFNIDKKTAMQFIINESTKNHAYNPNDKPIRMLSKSEKLIDVAKAADLLNISVLSKPVIKYFMCYPKFSN
jgi:HD superfamily phosphohydrolase